MNKAVIAGTGIGLPSRKLENSYFNQLLGEDVDTWLRQNVEIEERLWCSNEESTADLCEKAALMALKNAGIQAKDLNQIIISTDTPEYISPSTAAVLQDRIGATQAGTFDLNTACAGFVTAFDTAAKYIQADDQYQYILVIGAYAMSKYLNLQDKKTVTLFADGAGAVVLKAEKESPNGYLAALQRTQGEYCEWMGIYAGGSKYPVNQEVVQAGDHQLKFVKRFPKELNPKVWTEMTHEILNKIGHKPDDFAQYFMTQINVNSIRETMDHLGLPHSKAITIMHKLGYTGSAAIPTALHMAIEQGKLKRGDLFMMIGSGGGLAFAAAAVRY